MRGPLTIAKNCTDWHCPTAIQIGVAAFIRDGYLARHVRRMRAIYAARKQHLLGQLDTHFAQWLAPVPSSYGMHVCAMAADDVDVEEMCARVRADGVQLHSLRRYYAGAATRAGIIFGLGTSDESAIDNGLWSLRKAALASPAASARRALHP
jgi:GntR family transcriptional regulator/MocR family aminotransferase